MILIMILILMNILMGYEVIPLEILMDNIAIILGNIQRLSVEITQGIHSFPKI